MWAIIFSFIAIILTCFALYLQSKKENFPKIFGIYSQAGKWYYLKYIMFYTILELRKAKAKILNFFGDDDNETSDKKTVDVHAFEKLQPLSTHENAFDAVFFQAVNIDGYYICTGTERRHGGKTFGLFYLVVPGIGLLGNEKLPSTLLETDSVSIHLVDAFSAEGIRFSPVKPMEHWKMSFNGKMKLESDPSKTFDVQLQADWTSDCPFFLYERDMNNKALARAIAREEWTDNFFKALKSEHQNHYEQMGHLKGTLVVNNKKHDLNMWAFRDHSFGNKRDWTLLHRYAFHMIYLSNETRILIGVISHLKTMSHFEVGYIVNKNKSIDSIESCDLQLYQHGENGTPGKEIAFTFVAKKKTYRVKAIVNYESEHYKGHNNEARLIERFLSYDVNGIKGKGIAEWHYNVGKK